MKAVILAAGLGTRLRPLTLYRAKAVMPLLNIPMLFYNLSFLQKQGIKNTIINLHHLPQTVEKELLKRRSPGINIMFSHEPVILGTGGAINKVKPSLKKGTFILMNGDTIIDLDFKNVLRFHQNKGALATMVVLPYPSDKSYSSILLDDQSRIISIEEKNSGAKLLGKRWMFSGVHILEPETIDYLSAVEFSDIVKDFYIPAIENGESVFGFKHSGFCQEVGTPRDYMEANAKLIYMGSKKIASIWGIECDIRNKAIDDSISNHISVKIVSDETVEIKEGIKIKDWAVLGKDSKVEEECTIQSSVFFSDCVIGKQSYISNSILLPEVHVNPGSKIKNSILIPEASGFTKISIVSKV